MLSLGGEKVAAGIPRFQTKSQRLASSDDIFCTKYYTSRHFFHVFNLKNYSRSHGVRTGSMF